MLNLIEEKYAKAKIGKDNIIIIILVTIQIRVSKPKLRQYSYVHR